MAKFTDEQEELLCETLGSLAAMADSLYESGDDVCRRRNIADFLMLIRKQIIEATELHYL